MKRTKRFCPLLCLLTAIFLCLSSVIPCCAEGSDSPHETMIRDILAYHCGDRDIQEWIDADLTKQIGQNAEWYVLALRRHGDDSFSAYQSALEAYLTEHDEKSAASRQKFALALLYTGSTSAYIQDTANQTIGEQGVMSLIFGLHLLNNGCRSSAYTTESLIEALLSVQLSDGGWAVIGTKSDADVTAMALQALAPYATESDAVHSAADRALDLLSTLQLETGEYANRGVHNPESAAQVWIALSALGIDAQSDARFIKNGNTICDGILRYRLPDGTFCHEENGISNDSATAQVFLAAVAYDCLLSGSTPLYLLDKDVSDQTTTETEAAQTTVSTLPAEEEHNTGGYRPYACAAVIAVGVLLCVVLILKTPQAKKNCAIILLLTAVAVCVILFTDFRTAEDYYSDNVSHPQDVTGTVTLSIRCDAVADSDGILLPETEYAIGSDTTVYDLLLTATKEHQIQIDASGSADSVYVRGLGNLYEFDHGALSGWVFEVNGTQPAVSCSQYIPLDGDKIEWLYSLAPDGDS